MAGKAKERSELLTRGVVARRAGCNIETVRYYEQIGVLPAPSRSEGGHRLYGPSLVKRLNFILRSRDLGFSLEEIRALLRIVDSRTFTCAEVEALARAHADDIRRKMADLRKLKGVLDAMADQCSGGKVPKCPIIDALFDTRTPRPAAASARM